MAQVDSPILDRVKCNPLSGDAEPAIDARVDLGLLLWLFSPDVSSR